MAQELSIFSGNYPIPSYLTGGVDELTSSLIGAGAGSRISIRNGVFRQVVGGQEMAVMEDRAINIVIVAAAPHTSRTYFKGEFVAGSNDQSDCSSDAGIVPDKGARNPQHTECATCPKNIKGSGQGDSKACRYSRRIGVLLEGDLNGDVYSVSLPAMSIFGKGENSKLPLEAYARHLAGHKLSTTAVVTEMRFDIQDAKASAPKLVFKALRPLTEEEYSLAIDRSKSIEAALSVAPLLLSTPSPASKEGPKAAVPASKEGPKAAVPASKEEPKAAVPAPKAPEPEPEPEPEDPRRAGLRAVGLSEEQIDAALSVIVGKPATPQKAAEKMAAKAPTVETSEPVVRGAAIDLIDALLDELENEATDD
jgi:hypothetical protein